MTDLFYESQLVQKEKPLLEVTEGAHKNYSATSHLPEDYISSAGISTCPFSGYQ
jgi:hypothetical protein